MDILFDITRLVWRARRVSPSGIDRVVVAYGRWLASRPAGRVIPVIEHRDRLVAVSTARFQALLGAADRPVQTEEPWAALTHALQFQDADRPAIRRPRAAADLQASIASRSELDRSLMRAALAPPPRGDVYLNVGHTGLRRKDFLPRLGARGCGTVVMIHDLIPITHPEFCKPNAEAIHARRIDNVLAGASLVIANSQATANDLAHYAVGQGLAAPAMLAAPLGVEAAFGGRVEAPAAARPYFICVGTIEARKNLAFLLGLWRRLAQEMGPATPQLVLVGPRGWENEAIVDHLERSQTIHGLVHEVAGLGDHNLARLMAGAQALLAPSFAEGFDLPLIEALSLGCRAIASDIPVHRELAGAAQLIDPYDGPGWISAIAACCEKPSPRPAFEAPTWERHFEVVERALDGLARRVS